MEGQFHHDDETEIGRHKLRMQVFVFGINCLLVLLDWLTASKGNRGVKILLKVVQVGLLVALSIFYGKNLYMKYYPGPRVTENRTALQWYRTCMFFMLIGIDMAEVWLTIWPLEDKRRNAEVQGGLLGLVSFLFVLNLYVNKFVATSGNELTYFRGTIPEPLEDEVTVVVN